MPAADVTICGDVMSSDEPFLASSVSGVVGGDDVFL